MFRRAGDQESHPKLKITGVFLFLHQIYEKYYNF